MYTRLRQRSRTFLTISRKTRNDTRPTTSVVASSRTNRPFFLFPKLIFKLTDRRFESVVNIQENVLANLRAIPQKSIPVKLPEAERRLGELY